MDLAGAYEFSRYADRLRAADPRLCADVEAMLDQPFQWRDDEIGGLAQGSDSEALATALRKSFSTSSDVELARGGASVSLPASPPPPGQARRR